jgi:predicted nuclease of restriction endonuclease-like (RecB) superfamily
MPTRNQSQALTNDKDYQNLLHELKGIMSKGLYQAYKAVDNIRVQTYWQIGERIVREELKYKDRADYGKYLIGNLAVDLEISESLLYEIVKFYQTYQIFHTVRGELSWSHYRRLIEITDSKKRAFYEQQTGIHSWSVRELQKQIKSQLFENTSQEEIEKIFQIKLPAVKTEKVFKDSFDFTFTKLENKSERELENKMLANIVKTLKEFGPDFCFLGQQVPIKIDQETHYVDLVLFHKGIPCNVLVELKAGKLESRDVGQMNKYINYFRHNRQYEYEKDTIGLIICQQAGKEEVKYALGGLEDKIFVAEYKVKLPSEGEIKKAIKKL